MPTIFLMEDDPNDQILTLRALAKAGLAGSVLHAREGRQALQLIEAMKVAPDLFLLDLHVPFCSGLELLERLRANDLTARTPVVMFTSCENPHDVAAAYQKGCNAYVAKPVAYDDYMRTVQRMLDFWLGENRLPPADELYLAAA